jgi:hypothetical protein
MHFESVYFRGIKVCCFRGTRVFSTVLGLKNYSTTRLCQVSRQMTDRFLLPKDLSRATSGHKSPEHNRASNCLFTCDRCGAAEEPNDTDQAAPEPTRKGATHPQPLFSEIRTRPLEPYLRPTDSTMSGIQTEKRSDVVECNR